jgi:hypothetical protein
MTLPVSSAKFKRSINEKARPLVESLWMSLFSSINDKRLNNREKSDIVCVINNKLEKTSNSIGSLFNRKWQLPNN